MANFDVSTPTGSDLLSQGDDKIREFKNAMLDALRGDDAEGVEAIFPGASPSTAPVYRYRGLKGSTAERPTAGQYGFYFDTTRNVLQRDNGSTWDDIGGSFPSGTRVPFYQATPPTGWTAVALNDKFLRVVTSGGTGGSTGGNTPASQSLSHSHEIGPHSHYSAWDPMYGQPAANGGYIGEDSQGGVLKVIPAGSGSFVQYRVYGVTRDSTSYSTGSSGDVFAYADIIIASKD